MSDNTFRTIPVPVLSDGVGTSVPIIGRGLKTFVIGGTFVADVTIEAAIDGSFAPLFTVDKPKQFRDIVTVFDDVRVVISNHVSGQAIVEFGGDLAINEFAAFTVPSEDGVGPPLDTSTLGSFKSIFTDGEFEAVLTIEVGESLDGPFAPIGRLDRTENIFEQIVVCQFMRIVVSDHVSGQPIVKVGGVDFGGPTTLGGTILYWGNRSVGAAADTRFLAAGSERGTAPTSPETTWIAPRPIILRDFFVRHNSASGNGNDVVYDIDIDGVSQGLGLTLATGAIGNAQDLVTRIEVLRGQRVDATATKGSGIGNANINTMFSCEGV